MQCLGSLAVANKRQIRSLSTLAISRFAMEVWVFQTVIYGENRHYNNIDKIVLTWYLCVILFLLFNLRDRYSGATNALRVTLAAVR